MTIEWEMLKKAKPVQTLQNSSFLGNTKRRWRTDYEDRFIVSHKNAWLLTKHRVRLVLMPDFSQ